MPLSACGEPDCYSGSRPRSWTSRPRLSPKATDESAMSGNGDHVRFRQLKKAAPLPPNDQGAVWHAQI